METDVAADIETPDCANDFSPMPQYSDSDLEASVLSENAVMEELTSLFDDMDILKSRMKEMYSKDEKAREAIKKYHNKVKKLNKANDESWKNGMFDLSKNPSIMLQGGRKSTKSSYIGVQPASMQKRRYKHRGRTSALTGRRANNVGLRQQLIIDDNSDGLYFAKSPTASRKGKRKHCLSSSIGANTPSAK